MTVIITRFIQGQDPDSIQVVDAIDGPDELGAGDYYARVRIGTQQPFERNRADFRESSDFRPNWRFSRELDETGTIPVVIQMWDADPIENNDDVIDLNPADNSQDLVLNLDLATCRWTGDAISTSSGDGDREHFGALEGGERGHISFDVACSDGDFDDDGIADGEERLGVFDFANGAWAQVIDLPGLGTNPCRKTILVEVDWVTGAEPSAAALDIARDAFDTADVIAPDGECPYTDFGTSQGGVQLITDVAQSGLPATFADAMGNYPISTVASYKAGSFEAAREPYFHYNVWVPNAIPFPGRCCSGDRGADFITEIRPGMNRNRREGALFMHELGHALRLGHAGLPNVDQDQAGNPVSRNCKPNYLSIMNYTFPTGLADLTTGTVIVDFSRDKLPTLDETSLDETAPLDAGSPLQTCWTPAGGSPLCRPVNAPLNWNGSLTVSMPQTDVIDMSPVSADITARQNRGCGQSWTDDNGDGQIQSGELDAVSTPGDTLVGVDDWEAVVFKGPLNETADDAAGAFEDLIEPTEEQLDAAEATVQSLLRCSPPESGVWQIGANCTIWHDVSAPAGLRVGNDAQLHLGPGVHLNVDLANHTVRIDSGARLTLDSTARID